MYYEKLIQWLHEQWNLPHILPQTPSKASTSIIKCPLPIPPNDGLQDISPIKKINTFLSSWWIHLVLSKLNKLCLIHHAFRHSKGFTPNFSMFIVMQCYNFETESTDQTTGNCAVRIVLLYKKLSHYSKDI